MIPTVISHLGKQLLPFPLTDILVNLTTFAQRQLHSLAMHGEKRQTLTVEN